MLHPNPLDGSCWLFQSAHLSTWFRCVALDLPGYGESPAAGDGLTMPGLADACWDAVDRAGGTAPAVLMGCSVGSTVAQHMYHRRPAATRALILTGAGHRPRKEFAARRGAAFRERGLAYRTEYARDCMAPGFASSSMADWLIRMIRERDDHADLASILTLFDAMAAPDPDWLHRDLRVPVQIITGTLDRSHGAAHDLAARLPNCRLDRLRGGGHVAFLEQPWAFDALVLDFLAGLGAIPCRHPRRSAASDGIETNK